MGPPGIQEKLGIGLNPPVLFCFILVSVSLPGTDPVGVKVSDSPVKVLRDQDVFIPCTITGYSSAELDLQRLSVHWTLGSGPVYMYDRGSHNPIRPGSELDVRLIKGNAGLSLAQVQITDEGEYTCAVTYDNERAEGRSALEVAVKPSASLVPPDVIIEEGTEGGVTCRASNYYPETIKFQWIKHLNDGEHVVLRRGVSTNEPLENGDGTFTVTSQLLLKPSMGDDGGKYSCVISHRSLGDSLVLDFILSVKESHVLMIRAVIGTLAALILPLCIWGYKTLVRNEPPRLFPITGSQYLLHMKKATLFFQISGFRPKPIHISIHLKRKWGESIEIYSWNSEAQTGSSAPRNSDGSDTAEMVPLVGDGDWHNLPPLQLQVVPDVKSSKRGIYSCQCTMYITPDMHEDDGAELTVRVSHMTLISPISVSCRLKVLKEAPKPSPIGGAERLVHLRKSTLRCRIPGSLPEPTEITLYLQRKGKEQIEILSWKPGGKALPFTAVSQSAEGQVANKAKTEQEVSNGNSASLPPAQRPLRVEMDPVITSTNGDSNCQCTIHITPDIEEDDGAELTVRVTNSELREPYSVSCQLEVNEETMLLVMDEDYTVRVAPPPRDPTDNFHTRAITLGRLEGLDNIALSPTGKLFAIREGNLYTGPVSSCINQILFSLDRRIGRGAWDMFKLFSVDPRGLLCAVGDSGSVYWGPRPKDESQNWVGDLGEYVGNYNCSDTDSIVFDPQGALYAITSDGRIQMWVRPAETDSDWLDLGTALSQRDGRDSPHVISFCPEGNLWWVSKADGKLYKGPQPTQGNPGYWEKVTFLGPDYHRYRLFGFIGATFIQKIQSFEFLPELGKIVKERNIIVNTETYDNRTGGTTLNGTYSFNKSIKEVSRFIHDHNIVFVGEAETTFTGGIPVIGMERASRISLDNNVTHRWDFTNTNEREVTLSLQEPVAVGSGKTVHVGASVQKAKVRVPYRVRLLTAQGRTVTIGGSWEGTTFYKLRAVPREARGRRKKRSYPKLPPEDIWKEESCYDSMYRDRWDRDSDISSNERFLPRRRVTKEPPKPSPIGGAERLVHLRKSTLSCRIPGSLPEPTEITLYLQRKGEEQIEILSWKPGEKPLPFTAVSQSAEGHLAVEPEREGLVGNGETNLPPAQRPLRVEMVPVITTSKNGNFNCQCTIHITPNIEADDGAELTVRVTHSALRGPISKSCRLKVNGVPPTISDIVPPLRILNEEPVTLTCPINGFKPKPLSVTWLKVDSGGREAELLSWDRGSTDIRDPKYSHQMLETEHGEHSNAFISVLAMKPTVKEDHGAKYICRTYHYATGSQADKTMEMLVSAVPELGPIQKSPEILYVGEEMTLSCRIHSFHPEPLGVRWYKGDEFLASSTDQAHRGDSHLLDCTSRATYRPSVRDIGKSFRCEVSHESLQHPKCVSWELKHLVSEPRVSAIKCHPEAPECNQPATLSCAIENYYPKDLKIRWYRGLEVISSHNDTETKEDPPGSGLFSKMTEIHLTPTLSDHGTEFHMEIIHNMKITKKTFCLQFKGFPEVKEITCNKYPPKYGEALTLSCEVIGCSARDITAEWREGNNPIRGQMRAEPQTDRDSVTFLLTLTPTAEHYGKLLTCLIKHKDLPQPIKKNISLKLPDVPPTLSEITASPGEPIINRETTLSVTISGFSQKNLQVRWYNSFMPLTANIQTAEPRIGGDRLYCCTSSVTYTPKISDTGMSIRCEVIANRETRERRYQLPIASGDEGDGRNQPKAASGDQLDGRNQPEIGEIECVTPPSPREGEAVTLQCIIRGQDVQHGDFSWSDGMFPIDESQIDNSNLPDGSGCISRVTFTPDDGQIRFEATFNLVTTERTYQLPWV